MVASLQQLSSQYRAPHKNVVKAENGDNTMTYRRFASTARFPESDRHHRNLHYLMASCESWGLYR
jgi:hypothetical protein